MIGDDTFEKRTADVAECLRHVLERRFGDMKARGSINECLLKELAGVAVTYCDAHPTPPQEPITPSKRDVRDVSLMFENLLCSLMWYTQAIPLRWANKGMVPASVCVLDGWGEIARVVSQGDGQFVVRVSPIIRNEMLPFPIQELEGIFDDRGAAEREAERAVSDMVRMFFSTVSAAP